jgi:Ca2+-binding RTX toxin-like protein
MSNPFDTLESRVLMSASLVNGVLKVTGTKKSDSISVQWVDLPHLGAPRVVTVTEITNGQLKSKNFPIPQVKRLEIRGGGGNDLLGTLGSKKVPIFVDGGGGNDSFSGATIEAKCTLLGGAGDDVLNGGPKDDSLNGGGGNDSLNGQAGNDRLIGDKGIDQLLGGDGNDTIFANEGKRDKSIDGGAGTDKARVDALDSNPAGVVQFIEQLL